VSAAFSTAVLDPGQHEAEWEDLAERAGAGPFLRPGWITAWQRAFGSGRLELRVARSPDDPRWAAALPLQRTGGALVSPTNWHTPEFGVIAASPEAGAELHDSLFAAAPRRVTLAFLDPPGAALAGTRAERRGYRVLRRTQQRAPTISIAGTLEDYERGLEPHLSTELRRRRRRLEAQGRVTLDVSTACGSELAARLAEGFAIEAAGWKGAQGTAIGSHARLRAFYTEVARWAAARGWLVLAFLRLEGRPIAFDLCLEHARAHYLVKTGYDPAFAAFGPGKLLRHGMIARAFRLGLERYEFLGDEEPWKLEWTATTRPRELVQAFAPSVTGRLSATWFAHGRPLAKHLRDLARRAAAPAYALRHARARRETRP
jgi:CelD/BcsL family acetyltransferase involved in cellulose biosynthesis